MPRSFLVKRKQAACAGWQWKEPEPEPCFSPNTGTLPKKPPARLQPWPPDLSALLLRNTNEEKPSASEASGVQCGSVAGLETEILIHKLAIQFNLIHLDIKAIRCREDRLYTGQSVHYSMKVICKLTQKLHIKSII